MPTVYAVAGGKGGTGKSVTSILLGRALAMEGKQVVLIDADLGGANLHTLMGVDFPRLGLPDFFMKRFASLDEIMMMTSSKNVRLISGAGEVLGMANLKSAVKTKLIRHVKQMDVDCVVMDLGAGTSFNVLDFFLTAARHVIVISPEPTALHNAYEFLKFSVDRLLRARFSHHQAIAGYLNRFIHPDKGNAISTVHELLNIIEKKSTALGREVEKVICHFSPLLVVNMAEDQAEALKYFKAVEAVAKKYLSLEIRHLATFFKAPEIVNAIKERRSLLSVRLGVNSYPLMKFKNDLAEKSTERLRLAGSDSA